MGVELLPLGRAGYSAEEQHLLGDKASDCPISALEPVNSNSMHYKTILEAQVTVDLLELLLNSVQTSELMMWYSLRPKTKITDAFSTSVCLSALFRRAAA